MAIDTAEYYVNALTEAWLNRRCGGAEEDLSLPPEPLGQFRLGHNIAIADDVQRGPFSRQFTEVQLETAVQNAVAKRLRRYDGDGLYHLGIVVGAVVLAQPGIPVVYAPSSNIDEPAGMCFSTSPKTSSS